MFEMKTISESDGVVLRYVRSLRFKRKPKKKIDPLTSDELERGEEFCIKISISGYAFSNTCMYNEGGKRLSFNRIGFEFVCMAI